jgi:hypothetical protein
MDKNKFWLGGRLFNTASPRLGAPTQRKARPEDGLPNATQGTSASWAPQRNARHVRKLGAPTHVRNARHVRTSASWAPQRNTRHVRNARQGTSATQGTSASWAPQRNARHVRNARQGTSATQGTSASWAAQRTSATKTQGTSAIWAPQRNARHVRKMVAQTQNSSATKTSTQGSTRLKDELEDG